MEASRPNCARLAVAAAAALVLGCALLIAPPDAGAEGIGPATVSGSAFANGAPVVRASVDLYAAGSSSATKLGSAATDEKGAFTISYGNPGGDAVLYAVATGGRVNGRCVGATRRASRAGCVGAARRMAAVLGPASNPLTSVVISEQTTVATVYALSRFIDGTSIHGPSPGLQNAGATAANLADFRAGKVSFVLANPPNGTATGTLSIFNTVANVLVSCTTGTQKACQRLFDAATPPRGGKPKDTMQATFDIARNPTLNRHALFKLAAQDAYTPALDAPPTAWTLALAYTGAGMDATGRLAFDSQGNIWVGNNFLPPGTQAGRGVSVLSPTGRPILGSPVTGGGLDAVGYGTAVDQQGRVWIGNYGGDSISLFGPAGNALSPPTGITAGQLSKPQGLAIDQAGNVWIPNFGNATVTTYPGGDPARARITRGGGLTKPFAVAIDGRGNAWVTVNSTSVTAGAVTKVHPDGVPTSNSPIKGRGLRSPQGIAVDSGGNVWVADLAGDSAVEIDPSGGVNPNSPYRARSIDGPWGIAVDGDDNIWLAGFLNKQVTLLCGRKTSRCPPGSETGDPISPRDTGFASRALQHMTAIQVDQSGNVWMANNWSSGSPIANFVGGDGLAELVGAGAPVKTPLIGPPRRP